MDYKATLAYLYSSAPMFQQVGSKAYKEGLENTLALDKHFGHPHRAYRTIHVGGTNGKGSCSHTLAAILQSAGYRVGLYTSPHLLDFRERIRINGEMMPEAAVICFVEEHRSFFEPLHPSFFELTTAMAFRYFADEKIDVAIVEVGLGGRLDCTNIIHPDLCIITNIGLDHTQFLGDTVEKIAAEKAGIIKEGVPVVIGHSTKETDGVFADKAKAMNAPLIFSKEEKMVIGLRAKEVDEVQKRVVNLEANTIGLIYDTKEYPNLEGELGGAYQIENTNTILHAISQLKQLGYQMEEASVRKGFAQVCKLTGLMGRFQKLNHAPLLICDTGHNVMGLSAVIAQFALLTYQNLHIVLGMVNDKDIDGMLALLPPSATYYFTRASVERALPPEELKERARSFSLCGNCYPTVKAAIEAAKNKCLPEDFIFVGGSSFIVADLLACRNALNLD